jgi:hypothetical protein
MSIEFFLLVVGVLVVSWTVGCCLVPRYHLGTLVYSSV